VLLSNESREVTNRPTINKKRKQISALVYRWSSVCGVLFAFCLPFSSTAHATVPTGFDEMVLASGLVQPTAITFAPDGRLFVLEQPGRVRIVKDGALLSAPFLTLPVLNDGEQGLLGIAFDPNFATNRYLYLYYTVARSDPSGGRHNRLSRFRASAANPDLVEAGSEVHLIPNVGILSANPHGGALDFGQDGMLYVAIGEHGDPNNSQNLGSLGGKMLRLNVANYPGSMIPADNPFVGTSGARGEIWAYGLRNPFTFNVDSQDGRIFINDVGGGGDEEINPGVRGANYGWPTCPGGPCNNSIYTDPVYSYARFPGCAVTGGAFYRGSNFPAAYAGEYFFSDYCGNFIKRLPATRVPLDWGANFGAPVGLEVGPDGSLYVIEWSAGEVTRIRYTGTASNRSPSVTASGSPTNGPAPLTVSFTATGTDPDNDPLTYVWNFGDNSSTSTIRNPTHTYDIRGNFNAGVTVSDGRGGTALAAVPVSVGNSTPTAAITAPPMSLRYRAGDLISITGTATDPEDGVLLAAAFSWTIRFHHDTHFHPVSGPSAGTTTQSLTVPSIGETSTNVWYRVLLTATDSGGLSHTVTRDILPSTTTFTVQTSPAGLQVLVDGTPATAPQAVGSVVGMQRSVGVNSPQTLNGRTYAFVSWSDAGTQTHTINAPPINTLYTATFQDITSPCDLNNDGSANISDVQLCVNQAIGITACSTGDINRDTSCNVIDVQRAVNAALGGACVSN
jgi:glucose/arabinose dehydrogenase